MDILDLTGSWRVRRLEDEDTFPATVPGDIHGDLLAAGRISDPFFRDQEKEVQWIGESDWVYTRRFDVPEAFLAHSNVVFHCEGLDTLATVWINDAVVGRADNMHREWTFDVRDSLRPGINTLEIHFQSAMQYARKMNAHKHLPAWGIGENRVDSGGWIRKEPCNFGWDWGPALVTCGIWRPLRLVGFTTARWADVHIQQVHDDESVRLDVALHAETDTTTPLHARIRVAFDGQTFAETSVDLEDGTGNGSAEINNSRLWWPAGLGAQPLYDVSVTLYDETRETLDTWTRRIGLRRLTLVREEDEWGESFAFTANGEPFFAKGANWIPADAVLSRLKPDDYRRLLEDAVSANMNMIRVWGGGIYEHDVFYDLCDELGLCVWQDFMFSCATYPSFDEAFLQNVEAEAIDNVRRLRNHACLALWCGNNELEQGLIDDTWTDAAMSWADYTPLFDELLPEVVRQHDPERDYWPSSPHTPGEGRLDFNDPTKGDAHLWSVWHGREPFEWYRTCEHRFNSEFGFQSFPEPATVYGYTAAADRNITSPVMEWHQRSGVGNTLIIQYMLDWFRMPTSFDMTLWLSQILQGMAMKYAVEHWRRSMPRGMGTLYWQLNDCWPVASWSSIDSLGNWKALHYMARHFFNPILISAVEDAENGAIVVYLTNDLLHTVEGTIRWQATTVAGRTRAEGHLPATIAAQTSKQVKTLDLSALLARVDADDLLVWLSFEADGETCSQNLATFTRPKRMALTTPEIRTSVQEEGETFIVTLEASHPALWTWLALDGLQARYSDNFFHLPPNTPTTIHITPQTPIDIATLKNRLHVKSLADTF